VEGVGGINISYPTPIHPVVAGITPHFNLTVITNQTKVFIWSSSKSYQMFHKASVQL